MDAGRYDPGRYDPGRYNPGNDNSGRYVPDNSGTYKYVMKIVVCNAQIFLNITLNVSGGGETVM